MEALYKRAKTGKIQQWLVDIEMEGTLPVIVKKSGSMGGALTEHREKITVGKQKRSTLQQAHFAAESDWKRKRDDGYKSLIDLGIDPKATSISELLEACLPQFNTDANGEVKPMLAQDVNWDKVTYPIYGQPKYDGLRSLMKAKTWKGEVAGTWHHSVTFLSRKGKPYEAVKHIVFEVLKMLYQQPIEQEFILDGELYSDELTFQETQKAVKKLRPSTSKVRFRVYDIVNNHIQEERLADYFLQCEAIDSDYVLPVQTKVLYSKEEVLEYHDQQVSFEQPLEGAMLRHSKGIYEQGSRSAYLYKVKTYTEAEYFFYGFILGQRGTRDMKAICKIEDGTEFYPTMSGTIAEKEEMYNNRESFTGKRLTVKQFGFTDAGIPRHPVGKAFRIEEDMD